MLSPWELPPQPLMQPGCAWHSPMQHKQLMPALALLLKSFLSKLVVELCFLPLKSTVLSNIHLLWAAVLLPWSPRDLG